MILIAVFSVIGLTCAFILQHDSRLIVDYHYDYVENWGNKSRIGNISDRDSRGYPIKTNWVNIGNIYWCSQDFEDVNANEDFGKLIQLYAYDITDWENPNYGEEASLWIYDISPKLRKAKKNTGLFYKEICDSYTAGANSMWKKSNALNNVLVLKSGPALDITMNTDQTSSSKLVEKFIVLKNDRVYSFHFTNDKIEVKIPINNYVTSVENTYDKSSTGTYALNNKIDNNRLIIIVTGSVSILVAILLILYSLRNQELTQVEKYKRNVNQIEKDYSDLIVVVTNEPDVLTLKKMYIEKIEDMIDIADQNKVNIIQYEAIKNRKTNLYAIIGKYVYIYTITSKDIK